MPSYLSLACAVNGYSTTTKYNSERISKSRESSPHRLHEFEHLTPPTRPAQSSCNNFLSPPNSSHSHAIKTNSHEKPMEDQLCSIETLKVVRKEGHSFTQSLLSSCSAGNLQDNGGFNRQSDIKTTLISRVSESQEFFNSRESKSFIQQRVERLYGPGALAQGFFVNKRQRSKHSESNSDKRCNTTTDLKLFSDNGQYNKVSEESVVRQSCSSSTLPVLRHLRPEFRAQLSIVSLRRSVEGNVVTKVTDQVKITNNLQPPSEIHENVDWTVVPPRDTSNETKEKELPGRHIIYYLDLFLYYLYIFIISEVKDGHYFLEMCIKVNNRLLSLAAQAEAEAEQNDLSEEVKGKLRSAYGKARLLVSQKMEQFKGLCVNNIHQVSKSIKTSQIIIITIGVN